MRAITDSSLTQKVIKPVLNKQGQATIEFALTMILVIALFLFLFQLTMIFAWGSYVHYATFMSARALLSAGPDSMDQTSRAKSVLSRMVKKSEDVTGIDKFPSFAKGIGGDEPRGVEVKVMMGEDAVDPDKVWEQGVRYTFKSKIFLIPLAGKQEESKGPNQPAGKNQDPNSLTLTSESWLGREPTDGECKRAMSDMSGATDNGC